MTVTRFVLLLCMAAGVVRGSVAGVVVPLVILALLLFVEPNPEYRPRRRWWL